MYHSKCALIVVAALFLGQATARADKIAHYTFDDGTASDVTGNGNDAVAVQGNAVPSGGAFDFDGFSHVVIPVDINPSNLPDLTVTMWVKADPVAKNPGRYKVFGHDDGDLDRVFGLETLVATPRPKGEPLTGAVAGPYRWAVFTGLFGDVATADTGTPVTSEWTFLAVVWDTDEKTGAGTVRFHAGLKVGALNHVTEPVEYDSLFPISFHTTTSIGSLRPDNFSEGFPGLIDDVQIFDEALAVEDVEDIFDDGLPTVVQTPAAPTATTLTAADIGSLGGARLRGDVDPNGRATMAWFEYGLTTEYGMTTPEVDIGGDFGVVRVDAALGGLVSLETYHFRVVAMNELGTTQGEDESFLVPGPREPIAHYTFDDGEPFDDTGEGFDGFAEGDAEPAGPNSGVHGDDEAFRFSGAGNVVIPININPDVFPDLTVTMWVKADASVPGTPDQYKTFGHDAACLCRAFGLDARQGLPFPEDGPFRWGAFTGGAVDFITTPDTGTPVTSDWTFLATVWTTDEAVLNGATVRFHANGNHVTETAINSSFGSLEASIGSIRPDNFNEGWHGLIDEVQVFDAALTVAEIEEIFAQSLTERPPSATTLTATDLAPGAGTALLRGRVNPNSSATTAWFEYGPTTDYGMTTPVVDVGDGFSSVSVDATLKGLVLDKPYHFRVVAMNALGTTNGEDASFVISEPDPRVLVAHYTFDNGEPLDDSGNGNNGTAKGDATPGGPDSGVHGDDQAFLFSGNGHVEIPIDINPTVRPDLTVTLWVKADEAIAPPNSGRYKVFGHDDGDLDRVFGLETFIGAPLPGVVDGPYRWGAFTGVTGDVATAETGTPVTSDWTFLAAVWDTDQAPAATVRFHAALQGGDLNHVTESLTNGPSALTTTAIGSARPSDFLEGFVGLIDEVKIFNSALTVEEIQEIFAQTLTDRPPDATTLTAADIAAGTARLRGNVNPNGGDTTTWFEYGLTTAYGMTTPMVGVGDGFGTVSVDATLEGLVVDETYHFRVVAMNALGTTNGADASFVARDPDAPVLLAHYTFDDGTPLDVTGNGNDGFIEGNAAPGGAASGVHGDDEAFRFDGAGRVEIPVDINPAVLPQLTVALWALPDEGLVSPGRYKVFGHDDGDLDRVFGLEILVATRDDPPPAPITGATAGPYRWAAFTGLNYDVATMATGTPVANEWTFLAVVYDADAGTVRFHAALQGGDMNFVAEPTANTAGHDTASIGSLNADDAFTEGFLGLIDEVMIFNSALTVEQIAEVFAGELTLTETICDDGIDNDSDGDTDCADADCDGQEECGDVFRRGDANTDGAVNLADAVATFNYLFTGGGTPLCLDAADSNNADDALNLTDGVFLLNFLFLGGDPLPDPGITDCGPDPVGAGSISFGCESYPPPCGG